MQQIEGIERKQMKESLPEFRNGDTVKVFFKVVEGTRERTQMFQGVVLKRQGSGIGETFTVRKNSFGVGVERMFPIHSPKIVDLQVVRTGKTRRSKLYYLRHKVGKDARIKERR